MLNHPAPFPQPGSWALLSTLGEVEAARIDLAPLTAGSMAKVHLPARSGASAVCRVEIERLLDATPLGAGEAAELARLDAALTGSRRPRRSTVERANALAERRVRSETMAAILRRLERRGLGGEAVREARRAWEAALAAAVPARAAA